MYLTQVVLVLIWFQPRASLVKLQKYGISSFWMVELIDVFFDEAHKTKADNISKPFNVQHNIHVQIDKASYVLQGLPPAWAHQLQSSNQVPAPADFETDHSYASTRARASMSPCRSASSASKSFSPLPKSKSWSDIRRKASKERKKSDACQDPLLLYKDIVEIAEGESGSLYSATLISAPRTVS